MTTYVVMRGRAVLSVEETLAGAEARQASEAETRIEARRGVRSWWLRPADWSVLA